MFSETSVFVLLIDWCFTLFTTLVQLYHGVSWVSYQYYRSIYPDTNQSVVMLSLQPWAPRMVATTTIFKVFGMTWPGKPTSWTLRKVSTKISLSMPRRLTRVDTFRLLWIFCFRNHYSISLSPWDGMYRPGSVCSDCAGWSGSLHYAEAILLVFSRDGSNVLCVTKWIDLLWILKTLFKKKTGTGLCTKCRHILAI